MGAKTEEGTSGAALLAGAMVQRADVAEAFALLRVRLPGETALILVVAGREGNGVGVVEGAQRAEAQALFRGVAHAKGVEARLEGARVVGVHAGGVALEGRDGPCVVAFERAGSGRRVGVLDAGAELGDLALERDAEAWRARGSLLLTASARDAIVRAREGLGAAIERANKRIERRIAAVKGDMARMGEAEALAAKAQWFVAEAVRAPRGARSLTVTDWSSGEARVIELPLDPARPAREQVEALFKRARRIKRGAEVAGKRLLLAEKSRDALARLAGEVRAADSFEALDALAGRARATAPGDFALASAPSETPSPTRAPDAPRAPYRTFLSSSGARILVGRGAAHNDALTFKIARPHDLWLHAKSAPGAHVVVPLDKGHACPADLLVEAAHLAAHFSDSRGEDVTDVTYVARRYVRKPRGAAPGLAVVEREKVLGLRLEPARLEALLAREQSDDGAAAKPGR